MNQTLPRLRIIEEADRDTYNAARRRYLEDPTEKNRLAVAQAAGHWARSQQDLRDALEVLRRHSAAGAI